MSDVAINAKAGSRVLAVACGPIEGRTVLMVGVVGRAGAVEGVLSSRVSVDGTDATQKIIRMLGHSRFKGQIRIVALNGIALAGLNVVDVDELGTRLGAGVLILTRERPVTARLVRALAAFSKKSGADVAGRIAMLRGAGLRTSRVNGLYAQASSAVRPSSVADAARGLLRLAHMIASGVSGGESVGRM